MAWAYLLLWHPSFTSRGAMCVHGASSCEQISSSIKLVSSSVVTDLGQPASSFLFMVPLSLKRFKSLFLDV